MVKLSKDLLKSIFMKRAYGEIKQINKLEKDMFDKMVASAEFSKAFALIDVS